MRDDLTRVLVSDWNSKISKYVPADPKDEGKLTPRFGYVVDYLRINYNIYVWANPVTNCELDIEDDPYPQRIYNFRSEAMYVKKTEVYKNAVFTDISYYVAMRLAINKAIEFIETYNL